jgi:hypothetical protein
MRQPQKWRRSLAVAVTLALGAAVPAHAQEHPWEAAAGYTALHDATDHVNYPLGFVVSGALPFSPWLSAVAEIDHHKKSEELFNGADVSLTSTGVLAGVRASSTRGSFTEFAQALAGGVSFTGSVFGATATARHFAVQPGIGLDVGLSDRWAVRGEVDARWLSHGNEVRYVVAIVFRAPK